MELVKKIIIGLIIYGFLLVFLVLFLNQVIAFDEYLFLLINNSSNIYLFEFFNLITYFGSSLAWILLIVIFWLKSKKKLSLQLLFAFVVDTFLLLFLKNVFIRPRPFEKFHLTTSFDFDIGASFPSGHSERAFSGAAILANHYKKYQLIFYALATLVSFSRIYIGLHFPLDTIIGAINGVILGMIVLTIPTKKI
jgi:undecaprenyl-diphosphatase